MRDSINEPEKIKAAQLRYLAAGLSNPEARLAAVNESIGDMVAVTRIIKQKIQNDAAETKKRVIKEITAEREKAAEDKRRKAATAAGQPATEEEAALIRSIREGKITDTDFTIAMMKLHPLI